MAMLMVANAANLAYQKAIQKTRNKEYLAKNFPYWMQCIAERLPQKIKRDKIEVESYLHRKQRLIKSSNLRYNRLAWYLHCNLTTKRWFEVLVLLHIALIGVVTGLDLEYPIRSYWLHVLIVVVVHYTRVFFTIEAMLKIISEGIEPWQYFNEPENGKFNILDFFIVVIGWALISFPNSNSINVLRMLRLMRLLTFIKGVPQLRAILAGLFKGLGSVVYIVLLLLLFVYLFAILCVLLFGENDPARFGSVGNAMISLFQISTLTSWSSIAYTSWYGCGHYNGDPYSAALEDDPPSRIVTVLGIVQGFQCKKVVARPELVFIVFTFFGIISAWIIMSLFIGVISFEMFQSFMAIKTDELESKYRKTLEENQSVESSSVYNYNNDTDCGGGSSSSNVLQNKQRRSINPKNTRLISLRELIDLAVDNETEEFIPEDALGKFFYQIENICIDIRDHFIFKTMIVCMILVVGILMGFDTDRVQQCNRFHYRIHHRDDDNMNDDDNQVNHSLREWTEPLFCSSLLDLSYINPIALGLFTFEIIIKVLAEGPEPWHYFTDENYGRWNCLDFSIVLFGFLELTNFSMIRQFPVVGLRLIRMLRILRLIKAFPSVRVIVDALLKSIASLGWITLLLFSFNYVIGCMCVIFFGNNDPVHFGYVGRAMFTMFRMETLDSWDQVLNIAFYGCDKYPAGYPLVNTVNSDTCQHSYRSGYMGASFLLTIVLLGAFMLPTVLIGIVSIEFFVARKRMQEFDVIVEEMDETDAKSKQENELFFTKDRCRLLRDLFIRLDADGERKLDMQEMTPFFHYIFDKFFEVDLDRKQVEALFYLMDVDGDAYIGYSEFISFLSTIKKMEYLDEEDSNFSLYAFPLSQVKRSNIDFEVDPWKRAMNRMDDYAIDEAWKMMLSLKGEENEDVDEDELTFTRLTHTNGDRVDHQNEPNTLARVKELFETFDADGSALIDVEELTDGLIKLKILMNQRQIHKITKQMDIDGDGFVSFNEFEQQLEFQRIKNEKLLQNEKKKELKTALSQLSRKSSTNFSNVNNSTFGGDMNSQNSGHASNGVDRNSSGRDPDEMNLNASSQECLTSASSNRLTQEMIDKFHSFGTNKSQSLNESKIKKNNDKKQEGKMNSFRLFKSQSLTSRIFGSEKEKVNETSTDVQQQTRQFGRKSITNGSKQSIKNDDGAGTYNDKINSEDSSSLSSSRDYDVKHRMKMFQNSKKLTQEREDVDNDDNEEMETLVQQLYLETEKANHINILSSFESSSSAHNLHPKTSFNHNKEDCVVNDDQVIGNESIVLGTETTSKSLQNHSMFLKTRISSGGASSIGNDDDIILNEENYKIRKKLVEKKEKFELICSNDVRKSMSEVLEDCSDSISKCFFQNAFKNNEILLDNLRLKQKRKSSIRQQKIKNMNNHHVARDRNMKAMLHQTNNSNNNSTNTMTSLHQDDSNIQFDLENLDTPKQSHAKSESTMGDQMTQLFNQNPNENPNHNSNENKQNSTTLKLFGQIGDDFDPITSSSTESTSTNKVIQTPSEEEEVSPRSISALHNDKHIDQFAKLLSDAIVSEFEKYSRNHSSIQEQQEMITLRQPLSHQQAKNNERCWMEATKDERRVLEVAAKLSGTKPPNTPPLEFSSSNSMSGVPTCDPLSHSYRGSERKSNSPLSRPPPLQTSPQPSSLSSSSSVNVNQANRPDLSKVPSRSALRSSPSPHLLERPKNFIKKISFQSD